MANVISVVTAAHAASAPFLADAYASLVVQELPDGWAWEWLVQEDGETGAIKAALPADSRISYGANRPGGPGVARTSALTRATGSLVKNLDADDQLIPGALGRDIDALCRMETVGWITSRLLDLLPDGSEVSWDADPAEGPIACGSILDFWVANEWRLPIHPVTLCVRRNLLAALGGWLALTTAEDTGLLMALNVISKGYFIAEPSLLYRKWPGQVTAQHFHTEPTEAARRRGFIVERAVALRALVGGQLPSEFANGP